MRRAGAYVLATLLLLVAFATTAAARRSRGAGACPPAHATVLLTDHRAALYTVRANRVIRFDTGGSLVEPVVETRGCAYSGRRSYQLWVEPAGFQTEVKAGIARLALSSTFVAYEQRFDAASRYTPEAEEVHEEWHVLVRDLRTGRVLHRVPTAPASHPMWVGDGETTSIVVTSDGSVAWIVRLAHAGPEEYEVRALAKTGERVLARGSNIDRYSLALARATLYWTEGGKPFSATLH
jgi:hypothetical protein